VFPVNSPKIEKIEVGAIGDRQPREALLPPRPGRQECAHPRAALRRGSELPAAVEGGARGPRRTVPSRGRRGLSPTRGVPPSRRLPRTEADARRRRGGRSPRGSSEPTRPSREPRPSPSRPRRVTTSGNFSAPRASRTAISRRE
jgi:hypothetical protein